MSSAEPSSHRSGRKILESWPQRLGSRKRPKAQYPILVPGGIWWPLTVSPCGGTSLSMRPVTGGWIRKPSAWSATLALHLDFYDVSIRQNHPYGLLTFLNYGLKVGQFACLGVGDRV